MLKKKQGIKHGRYCSDEAVLLYYFKEDGVAGADCFATAKRLLGLDAGRANGLVKCLC